MATAGSSGEKKVEVDGGEIDHVETGTKHEAADNAFAHGQIESGYEGLTVWQTIKHFKVACLVCGLATFAAATDGYQIGINGNIIANPGFVRQFATQTNASGEPILAASVLSAIGTIQSVGQIIGMTTLPFLASHFGRKPAMFALWFILAVSVLCESVAQQWQVWFVGKLFAGIGVGSLQFVTPTFSVGSFFAPVALQVMSTKDPLNFRTPIYTQWGHIGAMLIIYLVLPESPAWCAARDKPERAKKAMRFIYRGVSGFDADAQYQVLAAAVAHENAVAEENKSVKWYSIFKGVNGRRTIVSTWALTSQQVLGLTLFYTYAAYFFESAGIADPFAVTCITNGVQLVVILIVAAIVDRFGRRNLACGGLTTMLVAVTCIGILGSAPDSSASDSLLVFFACVFIVGLQCSGSTGWGFVGEISSQRLRPYTAGFAAAISCVGGVIMNVLVPYMLNENEWNWGLNTAYFYTGLGCPFAIAAWFIIPEPAGLSHAELDELFERGVKPWRFHKTKTALQQAIEARKAAEGHQ